MVLRPREEGIRKGSLALDEKKRKNRKEKKREKKNETITPREGNNIG